MRWIVANQSHRNALSQRLSRRRLHLPTSEDTQCVGVDQAARTCSSVSAPQRSHHAGGHLSATLCPIPPGDFYRISTQLGRSGRLQLAPASTTAARFPSSAALLLTDYYLQQALRRVRFPQLHNTCPDDVVSSEPICVVLHDDLADVVRREASRTGKTEAEIIELAMQRLALSPILDRLWERATLSEDEAMAIAVEEARAVRTQRRAS